MTTRRGVGKIHVPPVASPTEAFSMTEPTTRRTFLKASAASAAAASVLLPGAYAAASETLRIGLVGCGGRGTKAAIEALRADKNVKLVAMCDVFMDRLQESLRSLTKG